MTMAFRISVLATALFSSASGARLQPAPDVVAFTQVAVVNAGGSATLPDSTVVVTGDRIHAVVLNGRLLDRKALDEIQSRLEASAPHH